jgi:hypothetical protein
MSDSHDDDRAERIREIAYGLWEKEGEPEGRNDEFWLRAEAILDQEDTLPETPAEAFKPEKEDVDLDSEQSFPASDPPSFSPSSAGGTKDKAA